MSILYVADIDQDIDDIIAIDFLLNEKVNLNVLLDPYPVTINGINRLKDLLANEVNIVDEVTEEKIIFVGGALTILNNELKFKNLNIDYLIMNGGFVGSNIISDNYILNKFKNMKFTRTYNFNLDVDSTIEILSSGKISNIYLIGKNVCHSPINTIKGIWENNDVVKKYNLKNKKCLHDLLMVSEGLKIITNQETFLHYEGTEINNNGLNGKYTEWGSELSLTSNIKSALYFK